MVFDVHIHTLEFCFRLDVPVFLTSRQSMGGL